MPSPQPLDHNQIVNLANSLRFGILIVTTDIELVYCNQTVSQIFESLNINAPNGIPQALENYCKQFLKETEGYDADPLIIDCQPCPSRLLRWHISWFNDASLEAQGKHCMLVVLEDCYSDLVVQMRRDKKRYGLTEKESRVWIMLKFGMSYQEIADSLNIKVNTIKTHARNIYKKQRHHRPQAPRLWFLKDPLLCGSAVKHHP